MVVREHLCCSVAVLRGRGPQTLFVKCLPRGTVSRVWDCFFIHGTVFLFRTALALVDLLTPYLIDKSFEAIVQILLLGEGAKGVWALIHDGACLPVQRGSLYISHPACTSFHPACTVCCPTPPTPPPAA